MYSQHGDLCENYYASPGGMENVLRRRAVKTGEEESRERPSSQRPAVHVSTH